MKIPLLLSQLDEQLMRLTHLLASIAGHECRYPRFSSGLFRHEPGVLQDCLQQVSDNVQRIKQLVQQRKTAELNWLAQRVAEQMEALYREAASWHLRGDDRARRAAGRLHAKLLDLQQEQQRLLALKTPNADVTRLSAHQDHAALQYLLRRNQAEIQRISHRVIQRTGE